MHAQSDFIEIKPTLQWKLFVQLVIIAQQIWLLQLIVQLEDTMWEKEVPNYLIENNVLTENIVDQMGLTQQAQTEQLGISVHVVHQQALKQFVQQAITVLLALQLQFHVQQEPIILSQESL